jgi:branched-chain amino acid transport system permease protein
VSAVDAAPPTPSVVVERSTTASKVGGLVVLVGVVVLALSPFLFVDSVLRTVIQFMYLLALAQMWNLLAGYAGLVSIGQQAYIGVGGYALLYLANTVGVNLFLAVPLAALVAGVLAVPTAGLVFRLRGGYFAIGTWVVAEVYRLIVANTSQLGGGSGATITAAVGVDRTTRLFITYWIALGLGVGSVLLVSAALRSRLGLALRAVRDREDAAGTLGIDVFRTKFVVYVLASTVCGLAGAVIYLSLLRLQPEATFSVNWTAFMIFAVVIGGIGTITGPIVGTLVYFALQEYLADLGSVYLIVLGAVAIVVMVKAPRGLWGLVVDRWNIEFFPVQLRVRPAPDGDARGSAAVESERRPERARRGPEVGP